jgi:hypothetical protein
MAAELEARLLAYAKEQKRSEWIKAQPAFLGAQGKTIFDPNFDIDDGGLPHEKPAKLRANSQKQGPLMAVSGRAVREGKCPFPADAVEKRFSRSN